MATLFEMTTAAANLYELLTNGDIDEQAFNDTLEAMGAGEKVEGYCKVIKQLEADAEMYKAEKDRMYKKQQATDNAIARMKNALSEFMRVSDTKKCKAGVFDVSLSESKAVNITDENVIPARFLKEQKPTIDKAAIRAELMAGEEIAGAELKTNTGVRIK